MSDAPAAAAPAPANASSTPAAPVIEKTPPTALNGGAAPAAPATPEPAPAWGENWREAMAGDDAAALKRLQRFAAPGDMFKSFREAEKKIGSGELFTPPGEDAQPEEIAAFRKRFGVPETPEDYGVAFPETFQASDDDKQVLGGFAETAHKLNLRPDQAKGLFDWYMQQGGQLTEARQEAARELKVQNVADLRNEFKGAEYTRFFGVPGKSAGLVGEYLENTLGMTPQEIDQLANVRLPNGLPLGDSAFFLKALARGASAAAPEEALIAGDAAGMNGRSVEEEYRALLKESVDNRKEWSRSPQKQQRLEQLAGLMAKRAA